MYLLYHGVCHVEKTARLMLQKLREILPSRLTASGFTITYFLNSSEVFSSKTTKDVTTHRKCVQSQICTTVLAMLNGGRTCKRELSEKGGCSEAVRGPRDIVSPPDGRYLSVGDILCNMHGHQQEKTTDGTAAILSQQTNVAASMQLKVNHFPLAQRCALGQREIVL